jgi:hypothetical protein
MLDRGGCETSTPVQAHGHPSVLQPFKCKVAGCGQSFSTPKQLSHHMGRHDSSVFCKDCCLSFPHQRELTQHLRADHVPSECDLCQRVRPAGGGGVVVVWTFSPTWPPGSLHFGGRAGL